VLLSDFFDDFENIKKGLRHLRYKKHEVMAFQILDPTEIAFRSRTPPCSRLEIWASSHQPRALREVTSSNWRSHGALQRLCRGMHIDFTRMSRRLARRHPQQLPAARAATIK